MLSRDKEIRQALEARKKYEEKYENFMILGKRDFMDDIRSLEVADLVNFGDTEEEELEYGDPSGVEPFMMLDLDELTDLSPSNFRLKKSIEMKFGKNNKKWKFEKNDGDNFGVPMDSISIDDLLNTNAEVEYHQRSSEESKEGTVIELDYRFTGSGFKGVLAEEGIETSGKVLDFKDLVNIEDSKNSEKKDNPIIDLLDLMSTDDILGPPN